MVMGEVYLFLFLNVIVVMYSKTSAYFRTSFFSFLKIVHFYHLKSVSRL